MQHAKSYLTNLTALRGIAALLVVVYHGNELIAPFIKTDTTFWFNKLYLMVDLFFILSGFIMCHVYEAYFINSQETGQVPGFLTARIARIYPLHVVTLAVCVGMTFLTYAMGKYGYLGIVGAAVNDFRALPAQLLLLHSAHVTKIFTWNVPSWSISAEWLAYLLFPFLVKPFSKMNLPQTYTAIGMVLALYAGFILYISPNRAMPFPFLHAGADLNVTYDWGFARGILGFVLGMSVYRLYVKNILKDFLGSGWLLAGIAVVYCIYTHFNLSDLAIPVLFAALLLSAVYGSKNTDAFLGNPLLQRLGDWSFSIYMWHIVLYSIVGNIRIWQMQQPPLAGPPPAPDYFGLTNVWAIMVVYLCLVLVVGALSYRFIEKPSRNWINWQGSSRVEHRRAQGLPV